MTLQIPYWVAPDAGNQGWRRDSGSLCHSDGAS